MDLEEYEHWGEYEGPLLEVVRPPGMLPRLVRDETCVESENRELAVLEALARGEDRFALKLQQAARHWLNRRGHDAAHSALMGSRLIPTLTLTLTLTLTQTQRLDGLAAAPAPSQPHRRRTPRRRQASRRGGEG